ncbi:MAG: patatin-like phospholipase family protein [Acidobacteriota bacterium]
MAVAGVREVGGSVTRPKVALALAGGGPEGAIYEIGAVRALEESIEGLDLNDLDIYVGVSAGAFIAACLVNQLTPTQMCRAIVKHEPGEHPFVPETFFTPAIGELLRRSTDVPRLLLSAAWDYARHPGDRTLLESLTRLSRALPVGVFDNEPIRAYLEKIYHLKNRTNDFRELEHKLIIVAADLESGRSVRFGSSGLDHVPISSAVQASTALPGLYPPVEIDGRYYVDGVLLKTLHASVALDAGAELVLCVNPIVPVDTLRAVRAGELPHGKLVQHGLPTVLSQTFRTMIHSRLEVGLAAYASRYRGADVVLIEPERDDYRMFFTNIFSFSARRAVCEHAYQATRHDLLRRRDELEPALARHGLRLRIDLLTDPTRTLWEGVGLPGPREPHPLVRDLDRVLARLDALADEIAAEHADEASAAPITG